MKTNEIRNVVERARTGRSIRHSDVMAALEQLDAVEAHLAAEAVTEHVVVTAKPEGKEVICDKCSYKFIEGTEHVCPPDGKPMSVPDDTEATRKEIAGMMGVPLDQVHALNIPPAAPIGSDGPMGSKADQVAPAIPAPANVVTTDGKTIETVMTEGVAIADVRAVAKIDVTE